MEVHNIFTIVLCFLVKAIGFNRVMAIFSFWAANWEKSFYSNGFKKYMGKSYTYEKFITYTELLSEFKNAKKSKQ